MNARIAGAWVLMLASGFAALGYQIVWTQQGALWLGQESAAVLAVVTAFFGGVALGAWTLGPAIECSARPHAWYAGCEALIAAWSLLLGLLHAPVSRVLLGVIGAEPADAWQGLVAFCGTFVLLLPATAAMGATLPAMERTLARLQGDGASIAALYAANTLGAVVGVLAAAFWLVPDLGLAGTAGLCAAVNGLCAVLTLLLFGSARTRAPAAGPAPMRASPASFSPISRDEVPWRLVVTGVLGIGYEVAAIYVLRQVAENTVYTFALLLAIYLVGTALGAAAYRAWHGGRAPDDATRDRLLVLLAAACLLGTAGLFGAEEGKRLVLEAFGASLASALLGETLLAGAAFLLPTLVMGALFSHLSTQARDSGIPFSRSLAFNTAGAACAPLLVGVVAIPLLGPKWTLLALATGYLALASRPTVLTRRVAGLAAVMAMVGVGVFMPPLAFVEVPDGGRVLRYVEGSRAAVSVVEDADGIRRLRIDNRQQEGSSGTVVADARQALLPLLLHPQPREALFLGLGTGITASAATEDPGLQVTVVELLPEVIAAADLFTSAVSDGSLKVVAADARRYVKATDRRFDVIVSDNFHPARSGSGALYTVEHFRAVRDRLAPGGLYCQWLPLHQLDRDTLRSIVRSFLAADPHAVALLATNSLETPVLGLVSRASTQRFDLGEIQARLAAGAGPLTLARFGIEDEWALLGSFVAGPAALAQFAEGAPLNLDDRPIVTYRAPRLTYAADSEPRDRLIGLLSEWHVAPEDVLDGVDVSASGQRLAAYWSARDQFLEAGRNVQASADVERMLEQVRDPLLAVLAISPDFHPARDPLLRMASALAQRDPAAAHRLIEKLDR